MSDAALIPDELRAYAVLMAVEGLPELPFTRPAWHAQAACRGQDPSLFFPERGESAAEGKAICATCPVQQQCLGFAVAWQEPGVWGGTSGLDRRRMKSATARPGRYAVRGHRSLSR